MYFIWCDSKQSKGFIDNRLKSITQKIVSAKRFNKHYSALKAIDRLNLSMPNTSLKTIELSTIDFLAKLEETGFEFQEIKDSKIILDIKTNSFALLMNELKSISKHRNVLHISDIYVDSSTKSYKASIKYNIKTEN